MKLEDIKEGMYIQLFTDNNIYQVYSSYGTLYIDFRGEEKPIKTFDNMIYKAYTFDELEKIGIRIEKTIHNLNLTQEEKEAMKNTKELWNRLSNEDKEWFLKLLLGEDKLNALRNKKDD